MRKYVRKSQRARLKSTKHNAIRLSTRDARSEIMNPLRNQTNVTTTCSRLSTSLDHPRHGLLPPLRHPRSPSVLLSFLKADRRPGPSQDTHTQRRKSTALCPAWHMSRTTGPTLASTHSSCRGLLTLGRQFATTWKPRHHTQTCPLISIASCTHPPSHKRTKTRCP
jgi:hypothetical protein